MYVAYIYYTKTSDIYVSMYMYTDLSYYIQVSKAWLKWDISVSVFVCTFTLIIIQGLTAVLPMKHVSKFVTTFNT